MLMLRKENILIRKWGRQTILILPFYTHIRTQTLLPRLLTVPHCLIQQDGWLCAGEESRCTVKYDVVHMGPASFAAKVESKNEWCKMGGGKLMWLRQRNISFANRIFCLILTSISTLSGVSFYHAEEQAAFAVLVHLC